MVKFRILESSRRQRVKALLLFLTIFACCLLVLSVVMTPIRVSHENQVKSEVINHHTELLALADLMIKKNMLQMSRDVEFLASLQPLIPDSIYKPIPVNSLLAQIYKNLVDSNRTYDQVRLLGSDGQEILRAQFMENGAELIGPDSLQNKASRYYIKEANQINLGQVYFSDLDLNIEHDEIEKPLKPVVRVATKIRQSGKSEDLLLIINFRAKTILDQLRGLFDLTRGQRLMLLDQGGFWMIAPDRNWEWGAQLGDYGYRLQNYDQKLWTSMAQSEFGVVDKGQKIYVFKRIYPFSEIPTQVGRGTKDQKFWHMVSEIDQIAWRGRSFVESRAGYLTVLVITVLSAVFALALTMLIADRTDREGL